MEVEHPLLVPQAVAFRGYQANLARIASTRDTLVVLPTGLGKTVVALLCLADAFRDGARRALVLAPTRPLVEQHGRFFAATLAPPLAAQVRVLTGQTAPKARRAAYQEEGIIVATPQVIQNDVQSGALDLAGIDWIVFDEAHRATGDYPYTLLGRRLAGRPTRRLGLTASPGHDVARIDAVRAVLGLGHVEIRTPGDPDVAPYIQDVSVEWETLPLPPTLGRVRTLLQEALQERVRRLRETGRLPGKGAPTRTALLELARRLQAETRTSANVDAAVYAGLSLQAQAMKLLHAIEMAETQGSAALVAFLDGLREEARGAKASKATRSVVEDARVNQAYHVARHDEADTPKLERAATILHGVLGEDRQAKAIVFAQYRHTCERLLERLRQVPGARPVLFVGQAKRGGQPGMTQKQQAETLAEMEQGTHNILVATSVAEEGLDVPEVDLVLFYEPIASEIRSIQRRGRTGRQRKGRVLVLMTKGTQDEAAHWSARRREQQMVKELQGLRAALSARTASPMGGQTGALQHPARLATAPARADPAAAPPPARPATPPPAVPSGQTRLEAPLGEGPHIRYDGRERGARLLAHLEELGCLLEPARLEVGDYILSDRVAVERKQGDDLVTSILDGRLFEQMRGLTAYARPFLLVEGDDLQGGRNVRPEAVYGALAAVSVEFGVAVVRTRDALESARFLAAVARREQQRHGRHVAVRPAAPMTDAERQRHVLAGLPGVSGTLADRLLARFGSVRQVFAADAAALAEVEGIGPAKAAAIAHILDLAARRTETVS